jgi:Flp pilus assembly protein TadD
VEFAKATRLRPDWSAAWNGLGAVRLLQGDPSAARRSLERARRLAPYDPDVLANLAGVEELEGRSGRALALYGEVLVRNHRHLPSMLGKARLHAARGDAKKAADYWRSALSIDPGNAMALRGLEALGEEGREPLTP